MKTIPVTLFATLVLILSLAGPSHALFGGRYDEVEAVNGKVRIPLAQVSDGEAHYYRISAAGKEIRFFLIKSRDNVLRAAFDACDVCFAEGKGYVQDGEYMVCANCGQRFHSSRINQVKGGCNPSPLNRTSDDQYVYIDLKDIEAGAVYF